MAEQKDPEKRHQADQREIKRLQQELRRKDKALAEAAALLIASKNIQAYWGEDGDDWRRLTTERRLCRSWMKVWPQVLVPRSWLCFWAWN